MKKYASGLIAALVVAFLAVGAYFWWQQRTEADRAAKLSAPAGVAAPAAQTPPADPAEPAIKYPVDALAADDALQGASPPALPTLPDADPYLSDALTGLLGRKDVLTFLQLDGFVRRVVATVDNLARPHAAPALWPVTLTPGRFITLGAGDKTGGSGAAGSSISPDNSLRYTPFVLFIESVNTAQAIKLYARAYPLFQQAYEELGYPGRYFNDRLVAVIDHLLATPVPAGAPGVSLVEVKGTVPSIRPWVRYEFIDPALESLSAGQKMLLRVGPVNHRRLNTKLLEIRRLVTSAGLASPANTHRP